MNTRTFKSCHAIPPVVPGAASDGLEVVVVGAQLDGYVLVQLSRRSIQLRDAEERQLQRCDSQSPPAGGICWVISINAKVCTQLCTTKHSPIYAGLEPPHWFAAKVGQSRLGSHTSRVCGRSPHAGHVLVDLHDSWGGGEGVT